MATEPIDVSTAANCVIEMHGTATGHHESVSDAVLGEGLGNVVGNADLHEAAVLTGESDAGGMACVNHRPLVRFRAYELVV